MHRSASPLALFWTSEGATTGHKWPGPMSALGGLDATDVALRFFANVRGAAAGAAVDTATAFASLLDGLAPCKDNVAAPPLLLPLMGLTTGPCRDLQTIVPGSVPPTQQGFPSWR